jgi:hypothetical protein
MPFITADGGRVGEIERGWLGEEQLPACGTDGFMQHRGGATWSHGEEIEDAGSGSRGSRSALALPAPPAALRHALGSCPHVRTVLLAAIRPRLLESLQLGLVSLSLPGGALYGFV